jgi:hypothetical protein
MAFVAAMSKAVVWGDSAAGTGSGGSGWLVLVVGVLTRTTSPQTMIPAAMRVRHDGR